MNSEEINKEKIKKKCENIAQALKDGMTPQEIAVKFNAINHILLDSSGDMYEDYCMSFTEGFSISFWRIINSSEWHWEDKDLIWLEEIDDYIHLDQL